MKPYKKPNLWKKAKAKTIVAKLVAPPEPEVIPEPPKPEPPKLTPPKEPEPEPKPEPEPQKPVIPQRPGNFGDKCGGDYPDCFSFLKCLDNICNFSFAVSTRSDKLKVG